MRPLHLPWDMRLAGCVPRVDITAHATLPYDFLYQIPLLLLLLLWEALCVHFMVRDGHEGTINYGIYTAQ